MLVFYFILFTTVKGFLLIDQQSNGEQNLPANQYLTLSKFYEEEKRLQQKMENLQLETFTLRHDMDNSFVLLTAQLQQKLELLDTKLSDIAKSNETLQENKYNQVVTELQLVTNKTKQLDNQLVLQTGLYNVVLKKLSIQEKESADLRNESVLVSQEISNLKQLSSIQPLQEIKSLQQKVETISAMTNSLSMTERARSEDFLALYNMTTSSMNDLQVRTQRKMKQLENDYNTSVTTIDRRIDNFINETRVSQNNIAAELILQ
ncbi:unnamed protein product [Mytilus edulis]|uniref:Uncharacterized protein n=1 Tax=Mytilus edulis TaxID=6550 RepID=A0A8S3TJL4_MYTED|nr:unnamed protein product [Mytilus edulis]